MSRTHDSLQLLAECDLLEAAIDQLQEEGIAAHDIEIENVEVRHFGESEVTLEISYSYKEGHE